MEEPVHIAGFFLLAKWTITSDSQSGKKMMAWLVFFPCGFHTMMLGMIYQHYRQKIYSIKINQNMTD